MKNLNTYINEKLNDFFTDEYLNAFMGVIDYLYNEGVVDYNDDNLEAYANGDKEPDYQDIVNTSLIEYKNSMPDGPYKMLKKYPNDKSHKDDIEEIIIMAIQNYIDVR